MYPMYLSIYLSIYLSMSAPGRPPSESPLPSPSPSPPPPPHPPPPRVRHGERLTQGKRLHTRNHKNVYPLENATANALDNSIKNPLDK